jgi:D-alanyl-lipoteichoic acid acyltransferase DltB (MBOAT superfamily)
MLVADNLAVIADAAFAHPAAASPAQLLAGTVCFAFQIYGDFSGYSDIAAGVGALFGIQLRRNFAYPYFSQSLPEFWRRWHISLSTWFRDYVFIPLGGSRGPGRQTAINVGVTLALSGLWHGAAGHFLAWGIFHGLALIVGRLLQSTKPEIPGVPAGPGLIPTMGTLWRMVRTFSVVCVGWILFRAESVSDATGICGRIAMGLASPGFYRDLLALAQEQSLTAAVLVTFVTVEWLGRASWNPLPLGKLPVVFRWGAYSALLWCVLLFGTRHIAGFIYFQF